ncbi:MAG: hypothetical protein IJQ58_08850 [Synergistaceae bacterium]|nr:hypothetical protein [Synergistaceae bacterium]
MRKSIFLLLMIMVIPMSAYAERFIPEQPTIPVNDIKPGMNGYMLTVLKGSSPSRIPVRIVSVVHQKPGKNIPDTLLIKITGGTKLAQGMSGSPVYIQGRLAGAIRSGWDNSDQTLALVTPIEAMCKVFDYDGANKPSSPPTFTLTNVTVSGISAGNPAMSSLSRKMGVTFTQGVNASSDGLNVAGNPLKPGDSVAAMLVWGDVELSAVGAVTATAKDGSFLAFGHDFLKRGNSAYPSAGAYIHDIVNSSTFPFKLASATNLNGTITQDRDAAIAGKFGYYAPSASGEFIFRNLDTGREDRYKFRTVADEFLTDELMEGVFKGLAEELWGRTGQGTMSVNIRIDGRNVPNGWARKDMFFSEENIINEAFKQAKDVINAYLTQPYAEAFPAGFSVTVEATQNPKILEIEDMKAPEYASPGDDVEISVTLRGWRTEPFTRKFTMKIPEDASGIVEVIARSGGEQSFSQAAIDAGLKNMDGIERMLTEFKSEDANNELILELNADRTGQVFSKGKSSKKSAKSKGKKAPAKHSDFLPEEEEFLSETKERRLKEGTLKIYSSEYYIDGFMRRIIHTEK